MVVLLFSDLHGSIKTLKKIFELVSDDKFKIRAMFFAGDFVNMGEPLDYQEKFIRYHTKYPIPLFWVPGNNDFGRSFEIMQKYLPSVEGRVKEFAGLNITGVGGSPDSWAGDYQGEKNISRDKIKDSIFLSHVPPPNIINLKKIDYSPTSQIPNSKTQDTNNNQNSNFKKSTDNVILNEVKNLNNSYSKINSKYVSNLEIRNSDLQRKINDFPLVHICGHIHQQWGIGCIGRTKVVKLAASYLGFAAIMNLENLKVTFIEL